MYYDQFGIIYERIIQSRRGALKRLLTKEENYVGAGAIDHWRH
jgi:hypothetical protein